MLTFDTLTLPFPLRQAQSMTCCMRTVDWLCCSDSIVTELLFMLWTLDLRRDVSPLCVVCSFFLGLLSDDPVNRASSQSIHWQNQE